MSRRLLVVGGSYAGLNTAAAAREAGFDGSITLLGEEPCAPYQRPPLSKGFLKGETPLDALPLKAAAFYRDNRIDLMPGERVVALDLARRTAMLAGGGEIGFDLLALATGARPRRLPAGTVDGVRYLRDLADAVALKAELAAARSLAVVGGGFIGLEVASAAAALGKAVRLFEAGPRLLSRAVPAEVSDLLAARHRAAGVEIAFGAAATVQGGPRGRFEVRLADGRGSEADLVVAGLGAQPNVELAADAGIGVWDGIETDAFGRTSAEGVFAAGDCARHRNLWAGRSLRLESVQNAVDQARAAGLTLAGRPTPYRAAPRFWTDQYDLKLQMVGLAAGCERTERLPSARPDQLSLVHRTGDAIVGVTSVNDPRAQVWARKLLAEGPAPAEAAAPFA